MTWNNPIDTATEKKASTDTAYAEMYAESRRYRDYELTFSTWYTAFLLAILAGLLSVRYGHPDDWVVLRVALETNALLVGLLVAGVLVLGAGALNSLRYGELRYEATRRFLDGLEPDWTKKPRPKLRPKPLCWIYVVHLVLLSMINTIIFSFITYLGTAAFFSLLITVVIWFVFIRWLPYSKEKESPVPRKAKDQEKQDGT